jgi:hypothetical protein
MTKKILSKAKLLANIQQGWDEFQNFIQNFTAAELTEPTDAAGWTAKDHLMHMAVWEDGIYALLSHQSRHEQMGLDASEWDQSYDDINDVIWKQQRDKPLDEVLKTFVSVHQRLVEKITALTDEDLSRPNSYYQPNSDDDQPVIGWIIADTYEHYAEHQPWIAAIVGR